MEVFGISLVVLLIAGIIVMPIVAFVVASATKKRVAVLAAALEKREAELRWVYDKTRALEKRLAELENRAPLIAAPRTASGEAIDAAQQHATPAPDAGLVPGTGSHSDPLRSVTVPLDAALAAQSAAATPIASAEHPTHASDTGPTRAELTGDLLPTRAVSDDSEDATVLPGATNPRAPEPPRASEPPRPPPPPPPPRKPTKPPEPEVPFEQKLAAWLTRIGAGVALLGVLYFFKYAVDTNLIGPTGRVLVGVGAGLALLVAAEVFRKSTQAAFLQILVGLGLALLFASCWAGSVLYALLPVTAGFIGNAVVLLVGAALAWHHRGQAILVLSLVAAFLNPVLLSTGQDRPFALFAYLLVFTGVMLAVAVRLRFAIAIAVAVLGVAVIFGGWYERYFDIHDFTSSEIDQPPETLIGAYHALGARAVPLLFVALFALEWLGAAVFLERSGATKRWTVPLALASLLLAHAGCAALLPDQPLWLGGSMVLAGGVAIASLHYLGRTDLLMVPMIAAFLLLAVRLPDVPGGDDRLILAILGVWTSAYVIAFVQSAARTQQTIAPGAAIRGAIGLAVFALLAAFLLLPNEKSTALALIVVVVALALVVLAHKAGLAGLAIAGAVGALLLLSFAVEERPRGGPHDVDWALLGTFVAWSLVHVGGVVYGAARGRAMKWLDLATVSLSTAALLLLVIGATRDELPTLRALAAALCGAIDLGIATYLARARPDLRSWVSILAAQALGMFAVSVGLGISGATVTIAWAVLAFVAAMMWSHDRTPTWAIALGALVAATLVRVLAIDVGDAESALQSFRWSDGRLGLYQLTPIVNARALALLGTGGALLASALTLSRAHARQPSSAHRTIAGVLATLGHIVLIALCVSELRAYVMILPEPPPVQLDSAEFSAFWETVDAAKSAQYSKVNMVSTVTLAGAAMALLAIGFAFKDAFHRYLGLAVFAGTLAKLIGWDVWNLARTYQIVVLTVVGALLLGSGFMYARLRTLFTGKVAALFAAITFAAALQALPATAQSPDPAEPLAVHSFASRRTIEGVTAPGDHRVVIDVPLHAASLSRELFDDIRIAGPDGMAAPYIVRTVAPVDPDASREGTIYTPGSRADGYVALFEIPAGPPHCRVELTVSGPTPYLRRVDLEAGETDQDLRLVATGGYVYSIDADNGPVARSTVRYPRSIARWMRVTLRPDREARDNGITAARFFSCQRELGEPSRDRVPLTIVATTRDAEAHTTSVDLDVGSEGLPLDRLIFDVDTPEFVRRVDVYASSFKNAWPYVTCAYLYRVQDPLAPEETTVVSLPNPMRKRWLRLTIRDGDDAPLVVKSAVGELARREIVFRASKAGPHRLYIGDKNGTSPSYDLDEILARRTVDQPLATATMGPIEPNPELGKPTVPSTLPLTERYRGPIGIVLGVLLLGLAGWAVRLVRSNRTEP